MIVRMATPAREFYLPFLRKEQRAKDTYSFYFEKTEQLEYIPGQYIRMTLDLPEEDPRGFRRPFSLCASPLDSEIMITTKVVERPSIFKQKLVSLLSGERIKFFGPIGGFVLPQDLQTPLVFLAGGIGITPFYSMLRYASQTNFQTPTTLIASFSTVEEAAFYDELKDISSQNSYLQAVYTITHPEESQQEWKGENGRISDEMIKKYVADPLNAYYMICGPEGMVNAMIETVSGMGVSENQIKRENFSGY